MSVCCNVVGTCRTHRSYEVKINLDVFGPLMLDGGGEHIDNTDVATIHQCGVTKRGVDF